MLFQVFQYYIFAISWFRGHLSGKGPHDYRRVSFFLKNGGKKSFSVEGAGLNAYSSTQIDLCVKTVSPPAAEVTWTSLCETRRVWGCHVCPCPICASHSVFQNFVNFRSPDSCFSLYTSSYNLGKCSPGQWHRQDSQMQWNNAGRQFRGDWHSLNCNEFKSPLWLIGELCLPLDLMPLSSLWNIELSQESPFRVH